MKAHIKILSAVALLVTATLSAQAAFNTLDVLVGFRSTAATSDLEINIGNISVLSTDTTTTLLGNYNASLTSVFGASWATTGGINWSAAGTDNTNNIDLISAKWGTAAGTLGTQNSTAWSATSTSGLGLASSAIVVAGQGYTGANATALANPNAISIPKSILESWSNQQTTTSFAWGTSPFTNSTVNNTTNRVNTSVAASVIDLYQMTADTAGHFLGTLSLTSTGDLFFTAVLTPVPEPSTYALILGAAALGFVMIRRRKQTLA